MDLTSPTVIDYITVTPVRPSPKSFASLYFYSSTKLPDEIINSRFSKSLPSSRTLLITGLLPCISQDRLKSFLVRVKSQHSSLEKNLSIELDDSIPRDTTATLIDSVFMLDALTSDAFERSFTENKRVLQRVAKGLPPNPCRIQWPTFSSETSQSTPKSPWKHALIVFHKAAFLRNIVSALQRSDTTLPLIWETEEELANEVGPRCWLREECEKQNVNPRFLQEDIDHFMEDYDKRISAEERAAKARAEAGDGEAEWQVVDRRHTARTGHARKRAAPHTDSVQKQALDKAHKKRARLEIASNYTRIKQLSDVYRKQLNSAKTTHDIVQERTTRLKNARKFKP